MNIVLCDFEVVTEHAVVADFQAFDSGGFSMIGFESGNTRPGIARKRPDLV